MYPYDTKGKESLWRNTKEKIDGLKERFNLKQAGYYIGGYGDSSYCTPNGVEISTDAINLLKTEGYTFNTYRTLSQT